MKQTNSQKTNKKWQKRKRPRSKKLKCELDTLLKSFLTLGYNGTVMYSLMDFNKYCLFLHEFSYDRVEEPTYLKQRQPIQFHTIE